MRKEWIRARHPGEVFDEKWLGGARNAYFWRGRAWFEKREYDKAIQDYDEAIRLIPKYDEVYYWRGLAWVAKQEYRKAIKDLDTAILLGPSYSFVYCELARLLATCPEEGVRNGQRAIELATRACGLSDWKCGWDLEVLAAAYAEVGQFDEAAHFQQKALTDAAYCDENKSRALQLLQLYTEKRLL